MVVEATISAATTRKTLGSIKPAPHSIAKRVDKCRVNNMVPLTTVAGQLKENRTRDGMIGHVQAASKVGAIAA